MGWCGQSYSEGLSLDFKQLKPHLSSKLIVFYGLRLQFNF